MSVVLETTLGPMTLDLYVGSRPKLSNNFLKLCSLKFYNLHLFHTVQSSFLAQSGDPSNTGVGKGECVFKRVYGDQATFFHGERMPKISHSKTGLLSMVNVGDDMFGSQFFITLADHLSQLDHDGHSVFGEVVEGHEVLDKFNALITDQDHRPLQEVRVTHTVILEDPFESLPGLEVMSRSPSPSQMMRQSDRLGADEEFSSDEERSQEEVEEKRASKEARAQATILEMVGDLPDADMAPPENVLFVCKLNPVTTDEDLEVIFARFGKVVSCEVIRDSKTGDSLQYAFVEFEDVKACENAYFKMDNVLIDDRRIHVDFSQSVAKYKWKPSKNRRWAKNK